MKINSEIKSEIQQNIVRRIYIAIQKYIPFVKGIYYNILHFLLILGCCIVLLFNNNVYHLSILLLIVSLDSISIVFLHDCPLTKLEKQYLNISGRELMNIAYKKLGVLYKCDHFYESQLELLINVWSLVVLKILFIIVFQYGK